MVTSAFLELRSAVAAFLYAVDQKRGWKTVDSTPRRVLAEAQRRHEAVTQTRAALHKAMATEEIGDAVPDSIFAALGAFDTATKDHLRDCWLGSNDDEQVVADRYAAVRRAENDLMDAVRAYAGRHAREFEAQAEQNRAMAKEARHAES